ncbi:MAG: polysaccharide pyruvyl transferase family protein [Planctomycetota bacterium]|jgi:colanic acid/amylovoran biosynthesis protein
MLRVVQRELSRRLDDVVCYAYVSREQASLADACGISPIALGNDRLGRICGVAISERWAMYKGLIARGDVKRLMRSLVGYRSVSDYARPRTVERMAGQLDAILDIHGFAFGDAWGVGSAHMAKEWTRFCRETGKQFIFMPQAWGSFEKKGFTEPICTMMDDSALYYSRDTVSQHHLAEIQGKDVNQIPLAPDIVFRFPGASPAAGASLLKRLGVAAGSKPLIGIAPNMKVFMRTAGKGTGNAYLRLLVQLCDHCADQLQASVVLIPNQIRPPGDNRRDDRYLCGLVQSAVRSPASCVAIRDFHYAEEFGSIIANCELLFGSRFHALVFALSQGVPVLALSWSHKYGELLRPFGLGDFVFEHDHLEPETIVAMLERLWGERETRADTIQAALPPLRKRVDAVFDQVAATIRDRRS